MQIHTCRYPLATRYYMIPYTIRKSLHALVHILVKKKKKQKIKERKQINRNKWILSYYHKLVTVNVTHITEICT